MEGPGSQLLESSQNVNRRQPATGSQRVQLDASFERSRAEEAQQAVHAVFFASGYAALYFVNCQVVGRQLVLSGQVPSYHLKQLAQVLAQRVDGIEQIDNCLEVSRRFQG